MKKFRWDDVGQLSLGLEMADNSSLLSESGDGLAAIGGQSALSHVEVVARAELARKALELGEPWAGMLDDDGEAVLPAWVETYQILTDEWGFPWRMAVYVAWEALPKNRRWPATKKDLAQQVLGLNSGQQLSRWERKYPEIKEAIELLQTRDFWDARVDFLAATKEAALKAEEDYKYIPALKMANEMSGLYVPRSKVGIDETPFDDDEMGQLSEAELRRMAGKNG